MYYLLLLVCIAPEQNQSFVVSTPPGAEMSDGNFLGGPTLFGGTGSKGGGGNGNWTGGGVEWPSGKTDDKPQQSSWYDWFWPWR